MEIFERRYADDEMRIVCEDCEGTGNEPVWDINGSEDYGPCESCNGKGFTWKRI